MRLQKYQRIERLWGTALCTVLGLVMIYPLLWLIASSFKPTPEIFRSMSLIPSRFSLDAYVGGWRGVGGNTFTLFFLNTFRIVIPTVVFTVISSLVVGYGFARFDFPFKRPLFYIMIANLMLPNTVLIIPRYLLFQSFGWLNTYRPFYVPQMFAVNAFFAFLFIQFIRGIPRDLDESATIDGCGSFSILTRIILPLAKPAIFSAGIFQFIWTWNNFFDVLIYINRVVKFPLALALRQTLDMTASVRWNEIMAMSVLSMLPPMLVFFFAQKYFVEGIVTSGLKG